MPTGEPLLRRATRAGAHHPESARNAPPVQRSDGLPDQHQQPVKNKANVLGTSSGRRYPGGRQKTERQALNM